MAELGIKPKWLVQITFTNAREQNRIADISPPRRTGLELLVQIRAEECGKCWHSVSPNKGELAVKGVNCRTPRRHQRGWWWWWWWWDKTYLLGWLHYKCWCSAPWRGLMVDEGSLSARLFPCLPSWKFAFIEQKLQSVRLKAFRAVRSADQDSGDSGGQSGDR